MHVTNRCTHSQRSSHARVKTGPSLRACACMSTRRVFQEDEGSVWNASEGQHGSNLPQISRLLCAPPPTPLLSCSGPGAGCLDNGVQRVCVRISIGTSTYRGQCWSTKIFFAYFTLYCPVCVGVCGVGWEMKVPGNP